jgi:hypothetical protein
MIFPAANCDRNKDADETRAARWMPIKVKQQSHF